MIFFSSSDRKKPVGSAAASNSNRDDDRYERLIDPMQKAHRKAEQPLHIAQQDRTADVPPISPFHHPS
jgi:hypothetical protein